MAREMPGSRRTPLIKPGFDPTAAGAPRGPHDVDPSQMFAPYECMRCHLIYDGGHVEVVARYVDCSLWYCPGCRAQHDSRIAWSGGGPGVRMGYVDLRAADRANAVLRAEQGWAPRPRLSTRNSASTRGRGRTV